MRFAKIFIPLLAFAFVLFLTRSWWHTQPTPGVSSIVGAASNTNLTTATMGNAVNQNSNMLSQRFAIAETTLTHRWASADARATNIIRQLAHNDLEYARMVEENSRIQRRQLVYRTDTAAAVIERAKLSGAPITRLTLPGLDGREIEFEIQKADLNPSGQQGTLTGVVADNLDSLVTLAFKGGREAFTIELPSEKLYLLAEPHEPGEIIVKKIDPETYVPAPCGTP